MSSELSNFDFYSMKGGLESPLTEQEIRDMANRQREKVSVYEPWRDEFSPSKTHRREQPKALQEHVGEPEKKQAVLTTLGKLLNNPDRSEATARINASGKPVYTHDPAFPGLVVRVETDGTRTPGRFENRRFIPVETASIASEPA